MKMKQHAQKKRTKKGQNAKIVAKKSASSEVGLSNPHPSKRGIEEAGPLT